MLSPKMIFVLFCYAYRYSSKLKLSYESLLFEKIRFYWGILTILYRFRRTDSIILRISAKILPINNSRYFTKYTRFDLCGISDNSSVL